MELQKFSELYNRIQTDPSILLLGQNYLSMGGETDALWHALATEYYPELHLSLRKADYPTLWAEVVKSPKDAEAVMGKIIEAGKSTTSNSAVTAVTKLRWSMLYTSAIDDTEALVAARGYTDVPASERTPRHKYMNKDRRYRVNLCGNKDALPPAMKDLRSRRTFERAISDRVSWIRNAYLQYYGVLVIDGYIPDNDWLNDINLFDQLSDLPKDSVYWFGAPEYLEENASFLVEEGIMTVESKSFYDHLITHMPELFNMEDNDFPEDEDPTLCAALTLNLDCDRTIWISRADITSITGPERLCVITDESLVSPPPSTKSRTQKFAEFLTQDKTPNWSLFAGGKHDQSFYIKRDNDEIIERTANEALKKNSSNRKPIIISGPSNSGKSMTLANLALKIAKRRKYPVIFIRGSLLSGAFSRLKTFIENWFCNSERFGGERVEKIVVVWDGSGLERTRQDYETLQGILFNCNVQVIGSLYTSANPNDIHLDQNLYPKEEKRLEKLLASINSGLLERFNEIRRNQKKAKVLANSSLLYLLQMLFKYEQDAEYISISKLLTKQFEQEKDYAESETAKSLSDYVTNFYNTQTVIAQTGIASSFQEQLKLISAQMYLASQQARTAEQKSEIDQKQEKLVAMQHLQRSIQKINNALALASEFNVPLPLRLLLKLLRDNNGEAYISINEETAQIVKILKNDTLINFEYVREHHFGEDAFVSYRNPMEAENYICLTCDLPVNDRSPKRIRRELDLLKEIINSAESEQEIWTVLKLARQFGPNGHGLLSEIDETQRGKDYLVYNEYWMDIAGELISRFPDDPETVLVYAHLTREYIVRNSRNTFEFLKESRTAQTRLETAIKNMVEQRLEETPQYNRLSIELCSTYQQNMRDNGFNPVIYQSIKERINDAFQNIQRSDSSSLRRDFSSNYLLDILLNAHDVFYKANINKLSSAEIGSEGSNILNKIDRMLNLDDLIYETKGWELLGKIKRVFDQQKEYQKNRNLDQVFSNKSSDVSIYLDARMMWRHENPVIPKAVEVQQEKWLYEDHYMIIHKDTPHTFEVAPDLLKKAMEDAKNVVAYLEKHDDLIKKTKSTRCIEMLMRSKWFLKTGNVMLAEKQHPALSRAEWEEINILCNRYCTYRDAQVEMATDCFIPAYFLKGVYEWVYSADPRKAFKWFDAAKTSAHGSSKMVSTEALVLCMENSNIPRTFAVSVERQENGRYLAKILKETTSRGCGNDEVSKRYNIRVPDTAVKYLFNGTVPKEHRQQAVKSGAIRFNLIGPQIGNPQIGGHGDE